MIVALLVGILLVPRLLAYVAKFRSNEMMLVTVLGLCFGFCLLVVKLEYSMVLGAFIIGAIIAEAKELHWIEKSIEPIRDMFSAIFFVAVGLLLDPKIMIEYAGSDPDHRRRRHSRKSRKLYHWCPDSRKRRSHIA